MDGRNEVFPSMVQATNGGNLQMLFQWDLQYEHLKLDYPSVLCHLQHDSNDHVSSDLIA